MSEERPPKRARPSGDDKIPLSDDRVPRAREEEEIPPALESAVEDTWSLINEQVSEMPLLTKVEFRTHSSFAHAKVKRIMKSDVTVNMVSAEVPVLMAKACELFIKDLTTRANVNIRCDEDELDASHVKAAISQREEYEDFLLPAGVMDIATATDEPSERGA